LFQTRIIIGIISKKAIDWIMEQKIQLILHCGDIMSQGMIDKAQNVFDGEIKYVKGNGDYGLDYQKKWNWNLTEKKLHSRTFQTLQKN